MSDPVRLSLRDWLAILGVAVTLLLAGSASYLRIDRQLSELRVSQEYTREDVREITKDIKAIQDRLIGRPTWTASR